MVTGDQVVQTFRALLGRDPESQAVVQELTKHNDLETLISAVANSPERETINKIGPFWNYTASFDLIATVLRHENKNRSFVEGHRVNYLGTAVNVSKFCPDLNLENIVEPPILPANWHTDIAEIAAALRAVELADQKFTMMELGCGWGCWMNITGRAARALGKTPHLIGVEADSGHIEFANESMQTNGFRVDQYTLYRGIAAAYDGFAYFPKQERSGVQWGLSPIFNPTEEQLERLKAGGSFDELPMISLARAATVAPDQKCDLLHIDIQGGEADLIEQSQEFLSKHVAYMVIGTHSRALDGKIIALLNNSETWELEVERPTLFTIRNGKMNTYVDGVQGWRNRQLTRDS